MLWAGLIFYLSSVPSHASTHLVIQDKIAHLGAYFIFSFLLARIVFYNQREIPTRYLFWVTVFIVAFFGFTDEFHQSFVPGRTVDFFDWVADVLGGLFGALTFWLIYNRHRPKMLLHVCCASCGIYAISKLNPKYRLIIFWYNPNIELKSEHDKRLADVKMLAKKLKLPLIADRYENKKWHKSISGLEKEPEGGRRCFKCFDMRLEKTFKQAKKMRLENVATSLTVGPTKSAKIINNLGRQKAKKYGIKYYEVDFKKHEGFKKSVKMSTEWEFYRQDYCGCQYSKN